MTHLSRRPGVSALAVGITLALPGVVAPAVASAGRATHKHKRAKQVPTLLGVSMNPAPTPHVSRQPAAKVLAAEVPAKCKNTGLVPSASNLDLVDAAMLCLIDKARHTAGLAALTDDAELDQAAIAHSDDMVAENYFDHVAPDGTTPEQRVLATGYTPRAPGGEVAENIAAATLTDATPAATVAAWMSSPGHRANILDPDFSRIGIGAANTVPELLGAGAGGTYTAEFA
jgi:uncharacterized protein YkwD